MEKVQDAPHSAKAMGLNNATTRRIKAKEPIPHPNRRRCHGQGQTQGQWNRMDHQDQLAHQGKGKSTRVGKSGSQTHLDDSDSHLGAHPIRAQRTSCFPNDRNNSRFSPNVSGEGSSGGEPGTGRSKRIFDIFTDAARSMAGLA